MFSTLFMSRKKMKIDLKWFVAIQLDQEKCSHLRYFMLLNTKAQIITHGMTLASITNWIDSYHKRFSKWMYFDRNHHSNAYRLKEYNWYFSSMATYNFVSLVRLLLSQGTYTFSFILMHVAKYLMTSNFEVLDATF